MPGLNKLRQAARGKARRRQLGAPLGCRSRHYSTNSSTRKLPKSGERGCAQVEDGEDEESVEWRKRKVIGPTPHCC
jgi:hypothetical protein